jgi:hypothetical protein
MAQSNDVLAQMLLQQSRQQGRRQSASSRLAEQMMAGLNNPTPVYSTGATLARAGSGLLAGLLAQQAETRDQAREDEQMQRLQDRTDKRDYLRNQAFSAVMGGGPSQAPQPQQQPIQTAPEGTVQREPLAPLPPAQARGEAPLAVSQGIARAALDPNAPDYAESIARINNGVIGQTMPGQAPQPAPRQTIAPAAGPPTADVLRQRIAALTALGDDPRAIRQIQIDERELARLESARIRREDRQFMLDSREPAISFREETRTINGQQVPGQVNNRGQFVPYNPSVLGGGEANFGLVPQVGLDADGNPVPLQFNNRGEARATPLPPGVRFTQPTRDINLGTSMLTVGRGGDPVASRPVDIAGRETAEQVGQADGRQIAAAPAALRTAEQSLALVDAALNHRGLAVGTGLTGALGAGSIPGSDARDFTQRVEQIKGRTFLEAFDSLRGAGAITEAEGRAATAAAARLDRAVSAQDFRSALGELQATLAAARNRAAARVPPSGAQIGTTGIVADPPRGAPPSGARLRFNPATGDFE